jgi:tetratricopeptide (TPR) repeat protein
MTKAVSILLGFVLLLASSAGLSAQTSAADMAVNQAVLDQANTILLRQKLVDAKTAGTRGDLLGAAKLYEDAYALVQEINSGIDSETAQTISGLISVRLVLARQAQGNGDLHEADTEVSRALKIDPRNVTAIEFKRQNDQMIEASRGRVPDVQTVESVRELAKNQLPEAATLVQDGKLLYEAGKLEEAQAKLEQALKLDPDNEGAFYYINLIQQASIEREEHKHINDTQIRMEQVEQQWVKPTSGAILPQSSNPWALTNLVHDGPGREVIVSKLDHIHIDSVSWPDGLPLGEVLKYLAGQSKLRDPDKMGINFLWNGNGVGAAAVNANPGAVDPATGLPLAPAAGGGEGGAGTDPNTINVKLTLNNVRLADLLDAIVLVSDHPIKYSVQDFAIVFSSKGPEQAQLYTRMFRVDPNTFYQGLQGVTSSSFGGNLNQNSSGGSGSSGSNNGGGNNNNNNNNGGEQQNNGAIAVVQVAGGGGRGGRNNGGNNAGNNGGGNGLDHVTSVYHEENVSLQAQTFFKTLGVDLTTPGKNIFFNDRLGLLFVRGTIDDLDTIQSAIETLNQVPPQIHIKARFIEVSQNDNAALGFDWYLGNFINGTVVANGGSAPSLQVPTSAANPTGLFPGNIADTAAANQNPQSITSGLENTGPALATITGILTDPNFRVVLHALSQRNGFEDLSEPEVTTISGRQTEMKATLLQTIVTDIQFEQGNNNISTGNNNNNVVP